MNVRTSLALASLALLSLDIGDAAAQVAPSPSESAAYSGLHAAAWVGDAVTLRHLLAKKHNLEERDSAQRTPLHVAAYASQDEALQMLAEAGADLNALEHQAYDIVTIAAVANDVALLDLALRLGASAGNVTSPYNGTALIAAAHLGHSEVVKRLITAHAPLDHVNNLGWTALIEAVILGDGGENHVETVRALIAAGADTRIADRQGIRPLEHAKTRGYTNIVKIFEEQI